MLNRAIEINPSNGLAYNNKGVNQIKTVGIALLELGEYNDAIRHFERALEIDPNDA